MSPITAFLIFWGAVAVGAFLFIRGASESAASSIPRLNEPSPAFDDASHVAPARAGVVDGA